MSREQRGAAARVHHGAGRAARLWRASFGELPFARQVQVHALHSAAEACFAVSLAGSLFFNVSVDAARPRIILYLAFTMAPFAIVAPALGPAIDRFRGGHRFVVAATLAGRAVVAVALARDLQRLLFYPEAFAILVLGKGYSVAKSALVPRLVPDRDALVESNARLSRMGTVAGAAAGLVAAGLLAGLGAPWVLRLGALLYAAGALVTLRLPRPHAPAVSRTLEYEELHRPALRLAPWAMGALRGSVGFLVFQLGFTLKQSGDPPWVFGAVFAAAGVGGFAGTFVAPRVRRLAAEDRILALSLGGGATAAVFAAWQQGRTGMLVLAAVLGTAANVGRHAFDSLVQRDAPDADRGRAFARFETWFQLAWVGGALLAVGLRPQHWIGMLILATGLGGATLWYFGTSRAVARTIQRPAGPDELVPELLAAAEHAVTVGALRRAVVLAAAAATSHAERTGTEPAAAGELEELRRRAVRDDEPIAENDARTAVTLARDAIDGAAAGRPVRPRAED